MAMLHARNVAGLFRSVDASLVNTGLQLNIKAHYQFWEAFLLILLIEPLIWASTEISSLIWW